MRAARRLCDSFHERSEGSPDPPGHREKSSSIRTAADMTTESTHTRRPGVTVLLGAAAVSTVACGVLVVAGALLAGSAAAYGALVGAGLALAVFLGGALAVDAVAARVPAAADGQHIAPVQRQAPREDRPLAAHLLVVVELARTSVANAVQQVVGPVGLAHQAPRARMTAGIVLSRIVRSRKTDQRSR